MVNLDIEKVVLFGNRSSPKTQIWLYSAVIPKMQIITRSTLVLSPLDHTVLACNTCVGVSHSGEAKIEY